METASKISDILNEIQERHQFTDQQLAEYTGVSRWTIYRIRKGILGETISTNLIGAILREQSQQSTEQIA